MYKQILANPQVELSATIGDSWIRVQGKLAVDARMEAKRAFLELCPELQGMYQADDGVFEVLYFTEASATVYSFSADPYTLPL